MEILKNYQPIRFLYPIPPVKKISEKPKPTFKGLPPKDFDSFEKSKKCSS
jgi:hypothetical protein